MKKLLLMVVDAFSMRVLEAAWEEGGKLTNLKALADLGLLMPCTSIFPSITHAATASIATGSYPQRHGVAGSHWYNSESDEPVYYSSDLGVIVNRGIDQFFEDFVVKLNHHWLQTETIFQLVERAGLKAACLNHLIFRGDVKHVLQVPQLLSLLPGIPSLQEIYGPSLLTLGEFTVALPQITVENSAATGGLLHRFGFEDDYSADILIQLAQDDTLPDFTLAYFPDNDDQSHKFGPEMAVATLEHLDNRLSELIAVYGSAEAMLEELCVVITGDHAQSNILADEDEANIRLDGLLDDFSLVDPGLPWDADEQLMVCPNLRMAQIYFRDLTPSQLDKVVAELLNDARIDQAMWRAELTGEASTGYIVTTQDRGRLHFWSGNDGSQLGVDRFGNSWSWRGDLSVVDGKLTTDGKLSFPNYPNAFERIRGGLECKSGGSLWITAQPGYEFSLPNIAIHANGGSHGSLHLLDSVVPLLVVGAPADFELPPFARIVDVAPLCLSLLGVKA